MLVQLTIKNYVLIENQKIDFHDGFSVLTGETGAGKSIILGALGLLMGDRADKDVVLGDAAKCVIEGQFDISKLGLSRFFKQQDLDEDETSIIRREVNKNGKSRAFINDTPVTLQVLKSFGMMIMDIHSQNQNAQLNSQLYRLGIIDSYANHDDLLEDYKVKFKEYKTQIEELEQLRVQFRDQKNEQEYHQFLFDELESLNLRVGEQDELEEELNMLSHAEEIKSALFSASQSIYASDENIVDQLEVIHSGLDKMNSYHSELKSLSERLQSLIIELKDIGDETASLDDAFQFDQDRHEVVNNRLNEIFSLNRKHGKSHANELIELHDDLSTKIYGLSHLEDQITKLEKKSGSLYLKLLKKAEKLSENRSVASGKIENLVVELLKDLGMKNAELKIQLDRKEELTNEGFDGNKFLFKANKSGHLSEMKKVASGGELSRLMLSFKYIMALKKSMPTIVFDEVDTGVSGEIADKLAGLMSKLGVNIQVISITHLPQVAARAKYHYLVYKENDSIFTRSKIKELNHQQRLKEIAAMLSGAEIEDSALKHAEKLLKIN